MVVGLSKYYDSLMKNSRYEISEIKVNRKCCCWISREERREKDVCWSSGRGVLKGLFSTL